MKPRFGKTAAQKNCLPLRDILLVALLAFAFICISCKRRESFPNLSPGSYVGQISGLDQTSSTTPSSHLTFYLERLPETDSFLTLSFHPGMKAEFLQLNQTISPVVTNSATLIRPLSLSFVDRRLLLAGQGESSLKGTVYENAKAIGAWRLSQISADTPEQGEIALPANLKLSSWLQVKGRQQHLLEELERLQALTLSEREKTESIAQTLSNDDILQRRAANYIKELEAQANELEEATKKFDKRVQELNAELGQLYRITQFGRSVDLVRRVATRENKWYLANWDETEDYTAFEESLAQSMKIDLMRLNEKYSQANEIKQLRAQVMQERAKVVRLQQLYIERTRPLVPKDKALPQSKPEPSPEPEQIDNKPWWERLDSVFGVISLAFAEEKSGLLSEEEQVELGTNLAIVDALLPPGIKPRSVVLLREVAPGVVHRQLAAFAAVKNGADSALPRFMVGAPLPLARQEQVSTHVAFFVADEAGGFFATPVAKWTSQRLRMNSLSEEALTVDIIDLEKTIKEARVVLVEAHDNLVSITRRADKFAGLGKILTLERAIVELTRQQSEQQEEVARLERLVGRGRALANPPEVYQRYSELSTNLQEAARRSAMADRLNRRKQEAALERFREKISIVKAAEQVDEQALAREVVELRRKQRELEARLGLASSSEGQF